MFFLSFAQAVVDSLHLATSYVLRNPVVLANVQDFQFDRRSRLDRGKKNLVHSIDPNCEALVVDPPKAIHLKYDASEVGHSGDEQA
jgi:hypothetical protein